MSYWILAVSGIVILCVTVQSLKNLEQQTQDWIHKMNKFTSVITKRLDIKDPQVKEFTSVLESNKKAVYAIL